ncbi:MAG TPA: FAD-dependent monooxygenase [Aestuariivirga sp.]|nr:FAD-dependent monooxygenase [Aestuariivirga sp.]
MTQNTDFTAIVAGGGPAGLAAAILLATEGVRTALITPESRSDPRTIALMAPSIRLLQHIGLWPGTLKEKTAPLQGLEIVDDTGNLVQAPRLTFAASEVGEEAFGWNLPLDLLIPALVARAAEAGVTTITARCLSARNDAEAIAVTLDNGQTVTARVALAADGANSALREAAGIPVERWSYDQDAFVTSFSHTADHRNFSVETHKRNGAFTTVPLPGRASALVWMDRPARIREVAALPDADLAAEIQAELHGSLGLIANLGPRRAFPMRGMRPTVWAARRTLLIGEAAHLFPPIGAQGLNMSLRDAAHAADLVAGSADPGADSVMKEFDDLRKGDLWLRQSAIGFMNTSLLSAVAPLDLARVAGLALVRALPPVREWIMREGLAPNASLPYAMRKRA